MMGRRLFRRVGLFAAACALGLAALMLLGGCVDQHPEGASGQADVSASAAEASGSSAGSAADSAAEGARIVATSPAVADMCARLDLDLVGVPESDSVPDRYADVTKVGAAMSPDMEVLKSLSPDYVLSPNTLESDLQPKYAAAGVASVFLDTSSVQGLIDSVEWLGTKFGRQQQADQIVAEHEAFMEDFQARIAGKDQPTVLILMGVPGSYIVATENSYVGSLVEMAGGQNVYAGTDQEFFNANTEDMLEKEPDVILRASHGLPDEVTEMFAEEFAENDIWQHFSAVEQGRVYDLPYDEFGMSAQFNYTDALEYLVPLLYEKG